MLTSKSITHAFIYPFKDAEWFKKVVIGSVFMILASVPQYFAFTLWNDLPTFAVICWGISLVPLVHINGYIYWLIQDHLQEGTDAGLPSWDDWHDMLNNGLRFWVVDFIYSLPMLSCSLIIIKYVSGDLTNMAALANAGALTKDSMSALLNTLLNIGLYSSLSMFFSLIKLVILPPTITHMVAKDKLKAAFDLRSIWTVFKQHPLNYLLPSIMGQVFLVLATFVFMLMFAFCFLLGGVILSAIADFYLRLVTASLYSEAYKVNSRPILQNQENGNGH
jgi:hypothetical protein